MFCEICGKKAREDALFCDACGNRLETLEEGRSTAHLPPSSTPTLGNELENLCSFKQEASPKQNHLMSAETPPTQKLPQKENALSGSGSQMPLQQMPQAFEPHTAHRPQSEHFTAGILSGIVIALFVVLLIGGGATFLWWIKRPKIIADQPADTQTASATLTVTVMPTPSEQQTDWNAGESVPPDVITPVFTDTPLPPTAEPAGSPTAMPLPGSTETLPAQEEDKVKIEAAVRQKAQLRADYIAIEIKDDWAFVDAAENDAQGTPSTAVMMLLRKRNGLWEVLSQGDSMSEEWQQNIQEMSPEIKKAYEKWNEGHI
ncbi:MAG: zinc ribbon domain-containing protein [Candidatus Xenobiia bacterium LiM19]